MAVFKFRDRRKNSSGTYDIYHPETEADLVVFDDGDTFQQKFDAGGLNGNDGNDGQRGTRWKTGTAITGTSTTAKVFSGSGITDALPGDMYLNTSYSYVYECVIGGAAGVATWRYICSIKGATGSTGATGLTGATGAAGQRGGQWLTGTLLSGTSSTTGAYSHSSMPASLVGDIYLNTSYGYVYQCTTAGTGSTAKWTYKGSIRGTTGNPGTTTWAGITDKPSAFPPASHTHAAGSVTAGTFAATEVKAKSGTDYSTARVRSIYAGTADMTAGSSTLASGEIYLVYE